jgi:hypothetical protein
MIIGDPSIALRSEHVITKTQQFFRLLIAIAQAREHPHDSVYRVLLDSSRTRIGITLTNRTHASELLSHVFEVVSIGLEFHDLESVDREMVFIKVAIEATREVKWREMRQTAKGRR